jgi:hypothetical protein
MITIEYCKDGEPVSDFNYIEWGEKMLKILKRIGCDIHTKVSTSLPVDYIKLLIARGDIDYNNVIFMFEGEQFKFDEYGNCVDQPSGSYGRDFVVLTELIDRQIKKRKANREAKNAKI